MTDYIVQLIQAIKRLHGYKATYLETVPVKEVFQGQTVWEGDVEVFEIKNPRSRAKRCYAWAHNIDDPHAKRFVAVLELPPVKDAQTAVQAAIMAEIKDARKKVNKDGTA